MDFSGRLIPAPGQTKKDIKEESDAIGRNNHQYYRFELNSPFGPDGLVCLYNIFSSGMLWASERGPATITNFLIPIAEYLQVHAIRTKLFGNPDAEGLEGEIAKQRREGSIAWIQAFAGSGGLASFLLKLIKGENGDRGLSSFRKASLSLLSTLGSLMMFTTYIEKELLGVTSKGKIIGNECKGIRLNSNSDLRASIDELTMATYPWIGGFGPLKKAVDLLIPLLAIRDSVKHFVNEGISGLVINKPNIELPEKLKKFLRMAFFIFETGRDSINFSLPNILRSKKLLGEGGFRDKYMLPVFRFLGCNGAPKINIEGENGNKALVIRIPYEKYATEREIPPDRPIISHIRPLVTNPSRELVAASTL